MQDFLLHWDKCIFTKSDFSRPETNDIRDSLALYIDSNHESLGGGGGVCKWPMTVSYVFFGVFCYVLFFLNRYHCGGGCGGAVCPRCHNICWDIFLQEET